MNTRPATLLASEIATWTILALLVTAGAALPAQPPAAPATPSLAPTN